MSYYLAFDLGAESGRAVKGTIANGKLATLRTSLSQDAWPPIASEIPAAFGVVGFPVQFDVERVKQLLMPCPADEGPGPRASG